VKHWLDYIPTERLQILDIAAAAKSLPRLAIEKDYQSMCNNFIFDEMKLSYDELINRMVTLQSRIKAH
jgi:hypothetical protein